MKQGNKNKSYGSTETAKRSGISLRQLYYWEALGLISPSQKRYGSRRFRQYREEDLRKLSLLKEFLEMGFTLQRAIEKVKESC
jgi:DNA-binding transcriptional MerR regulator